MGIQRHLGEMMHADLIDAGPDVRNHRPKSRDRHLTERREAQDIPHHWFITEFGFHSD